MSALMSPVFALLLPPADHGDVVSALPFVLPPLLIVAALLVLRARERRRKNSGNGS